VLTAKVQKTHQLSVLEEWIFCKLKRDGESALVLPSQLRRGDVYKIFQDTLVLLGYLHTAQTFKPVQDATINNERQARLEGEALHCMNT